MLSKCNLLLFIIILFLFDDSLGHQNNEFLFKDNCFNADSRLFYSKKINQLGNGNSVKIFWLTDQKAPLAVEAPLAFELSIEQILEKLRRERLEQFIPSNIEIYSFGEFLPGDFHNFAALVCKSQQTKNHFRIFVNDSFLSDVLFFKRKLSHEWFHYISWLLNKNYPTWLEEGLAIYFENKISEIENLSFAYTHMTQSPWMPLEPTQELTLVEDQESFYGQAFLFVNYLAREHENFLSFILNNSESDPQRIFSNFVEHFNNFQIAKYINQINFFAPTPQLEEKFFLLDDVQANIYSKPKIRGKYWAVLASKPRVGADSYLWIRNNDTFEVSLTPLADALVLSIFTK